MDIAFFFYLMDLTGTFVFAVSGAIAGVNKKLDIYGIFVLAIMTALGGGMIRDTMLGRTPPVAFIDFSYMIAAFAGAMCTWFFFTYMQKAAKLLRIMDAIGLGIFSVIGAQVSLSLGASWYAAIGMGILTGTGGGMIRDVLSGSVPMVMQKEIYAIASLFGSSLYVLGRSVGIPDSISAIIAALATTGIRLLAILKNWQLPQTPPKQNKHS